MDKRLVTQAELAERLSYNPETGHLTWIAKGASRKIVVGSRAGSVSKRGHRVMNLNGSVYPEHHIIWRLHTGSWPEGNIDHIDHDEQNNSFANLRDVSKAVNNRNQSKRVDNTSGHPGVWISKRNGAKQFIAEVFHDKVRVHRSSHYSLTEAIAARQAKLIEFGFHSNHGIDKPV